MAALALPKRTLMSPVRLHVPIWLFASLITIVMVSPCVSVGNKLMLILVLTGRCASVRQLCRSSLVAAWLGWNTFLKTSSVGRSVEAEDLPVIKRCGIGSHGCEYQGSCASL
jgi:hypothetical protein